LTFLKELFSAGRVKDMDQAWMDAAHLYNSLDERGRAHYWSQLSPEQQELLRSALAAVAEQRAQVQVVEPSVVSMSPTPAAPARRSLGGTLAIGCTGMLLGAVLTVAAEVVAVSAGIQAVSGLFALPGHSGTESGATELRDEDFRDEDFDRIDCGSLLKDHSDLYSPCMSRQNAVRENQKRIERTMEGKNDD
jgi:hypothetical protein